ncbi:hypothetical protein GQ55_5G466100 [Panicum hallii var. hallii]|uniref:Uncharacterized protein n=1 Tax=Panicum hallii var. hallii TaxID=1504633 RepID=A0A2T7DQQ4_9POAL|nr:hypothetical protein GQ55_5G466100 [Panicum hallii var. hallii]
MLATAAIDAPTPTSTIRASPSLEDPSNQVRERLLGPQRSAPLPPRRAACDAPAGAALAARLVADNGTAATDSIEAILSSHLSHPRETAAWATTAGHSSAAASAGAATG